MEAIPRLPMLSVELKENQELINMEYLGGNMMETFQIQVQTELEKHIREKYGDNPDKYKDCIGNFLSLQTSAYHAMSSPDFEGCNTIKKYYGQLHYMQSRFPFEGEGALNADICWGDAFTGSLVKLETFKFEQSAVIFNLGACHSYLGAIDNRVSEEGTRVSCVHFQCAAGYFQYLSDNLDTTFSPDLSQFMLKLYINAMLGQGQECLLEKSMQDNRTPAIIAKVAQQVVNYYTSCLTSLGNHEAKSTMGDTANKAWAKLLSFKITFYSAIVKYYQGSSVWDQQRYGEGVAYLQGAVELHTAAAKLGKSFKGEMKSKLDNTLKFSADIFNGKCTSVKKDNDFVYHDRIPEIVPEVSAASLVKPLPYDPSNKANTGADLFAKLVPFEAHLHASTYSEEKAKLLRGIISEIEEKDAVLEQYKQSMDLDLDKILKPDMENSLDAQMIEYCAALSVDQTPINELTHAMKELSAAFVEIDSAIEEVGEAVEKEHADREEFKKLFGKDSGLEEEFDDIKDQLYACKAVKETASARNEDLHTATKIHIRNLKIVMQGLEAVMEECQFVAVSELLEADDRSAIDVMGKLCAKVKEMEEQRNSLIADLRSNLDEDDVTSSLMTRPGVDAEDLFSDELKKHDALAGYIRQNLSAQENILTAVTEANIKYTKIRKSVNNKLEQIQTKSDNLILSCTGYQQASKRCAEGVTFFKELLGKLAEIKERLEKLVTASNETRTKHKPPPSRPNAPKPKLGQRDPTSAATGIPLSMEELAAIGGEDMDDFNDPEFLKFLQMNGGAGALGAAMTSQPPPMTSRGGMNNNMQYNRRQQPSQQQQMNQFPSTNQQQQQITNYQPPPPQQQQYSNAPPTGQQQFAPRSNLPPQQQPPMRGVSPQRQDTYPPQMMTQPPTSHPPQMTSQTGGYQPRFQTSSRPPQQFGNQTASGVGGPQQQQGRMAVAPQSPQQQRPDVVLSTGLPPINHHNQQAPSNMGPSQQQGANMQQQQSYQQQQRMMGPRPQQPLQNFPQQGNMMRSPLPSIPQQNMQQHSQQGGHQNQQACLPYIQPQQQQGGGAPVQRPVAPSSQSPQLTQQQYIRQPINHQPPRPSGMHQQQLYRPQQPANSRMQMPPRPQQFQPQYQQHPQNRMQQQQQQFQAQQNQQPPASQYSGSHQQQTVRQQFLPQQQQGRFPPNQTPPPQQQNYLNPQQQQRMLPQQQQKMPQQQTMTPLPQQTMPSRQHILPQQQQNFPPQQQTMAPFPRHSVPQQQILPQQQQNLPPQQKQNLPAQQQTMAPLPQQQHQLPKVRPPQQQQFYQPQQNLPILGQQQHVKNQPQQQFVRPNLPNQNSAPMLRQQQSHNNNVYHQQPQQQQQNKKHSVVDHLTSGPSPVAAVMSTPLIPTSVGVPAAGSGLPEPIKPSSDLDGLVCTTTTTAQQQQRRKSADDLLTAGGEQATKSAAQRNEVLVPTKVDDELTIRPIVALPYQDHESLNKLQSDVENFNRQVASLLNKQQGNSLCQLDRDWKVLSEQQEKKSRTLSTAVGRCSSYKNRHQDILPFDQSRVVLQDCKDDYINASHIQPSSTFCPYFIATQMPMNSSCGDFWMMIYQQQVNVIITFASNNEIPKKCIKFWPDERNVPHKHGSVTVTFTVSRQHGSYTERSFTLKHTKSPAVPRTVTQLQFTEWPEHGLPPSAENLLNFKRTVHTFHQQQRNLQWPIVVQCENGVGRSGTFCALYACLQQLDAGEGLPNILKVVDSLRVNRKYMVQDKAQLKFLYDLVLMHANELLCQRGIVPTAVVVETSPSPVMTRAGSTSSTFGNASGPTTASVFDVFGSASGLDGIKASVEKMTVRKTSSIANITEQAAGEQVTATTNNNISDLVQDTIVPTNQQQNSKLVTTEHQLEQQEVKSENMTASTVVQQPDLLSGCSQLSNDVTMPASLLDKMTPETFELGNSVERKRCSKADFFRSREEDSKKDENDPFKDLDPMWVLKNN